MEECSHTVRSIELSFYFSQLLSTHGYVPVFGCYFVVDKNNFGKQAKEQDR